MLRKIFISAFFIVLTIGFGQAERVSFTEARLVPKMLNYQGYLTDTLGIPIIDTLNMVFSIFDALTSGNQLWTETQTNVPVDRGIFNVVLGSVNAIPDSVFTQGINRWLELTVVAQTLSPRTRITAMGYAYTATYSDTAEYARNAVADNDWTVDGNNMYSAVPGSVGVGVASPTEKLDVNGAVNVSSVYKIGGNRVLSNAGTKNIFVGVGAGENNTTGSWNTFVGDSAGFSNTSGCNNTFSGRYAGQFNTTGVENTFLGEAAGRANTTGNSNTFLGICAGYLNTTGICNTFTGSRAGFSNTTGSYNTFSGRYAGQFNTTGFNNTFSGQAAGRANTTGNSNTFSGLCAGYLNTTGSYNTFSGYHAGFSNVEGDSNVFIGYLAGYNETGSNKLYIATGQDDANVLIYGEFDTRRVGIGTVSPTEALEVNGDCKADTFIGDGSQLTGIAADNDWVISGNNMYSAVPGSVGVGVASPTEKFDVDGAINVSSFYKIGGDKVLSNAGTNNIFVGVSAGENNTTGHSNTFVGDSAGYSNNTGSENTFSGQAAGWSNTTASYNTFTGYEAGYSNTEGSNNTFTGYRAGYLNTTGYHNTFTGLYAGYSNTTGYRNTFLGRQAGYSNTTGNSNTFTGHFAGYFNTEGIDNTFTGYHAGYSNTTGNWNTFTGLYAGYSNTTGYTNTFSGCQAGWTNTEGDSSVFIGYRAGYNETGSNKLYIANGSSDANVLIYGEFDNRRIGIGTVSPTEALEVNGNCKADTFIGDGSQLTGIAADNDWTIDGNNMYSAVPGSVGVGVASPTEKLDVNGAANVSSVYKIGGDRVLSNVGTKNIFVGVGAGENNTGEWNTFLGDSAGFSNTSGIGNIFLGEATGRLNTTGYWNTFSGCQAGWSNTAGWQNTFSGSRAGYLNTTGNANTFLGHATGVSNTTGSYNTFLGPGAGHSNTEGDSNVFIGYMAGFNETGSKKLYIANDSSDANVLIYGEFDNRRVGIGTVNPTEELEINGNCKADTFIGDGSQLTGIAADNDWTIDGNNMYSAVPGSVGVGVISPTEKLDVDGAINVSSVYKIGGDRVFSNAGTGNIFVGVGAGENNSGSSNTFSGYEAGYFNTTGNYNTFSGCCTGNYNTTGSENTFSGYCAGYSNAEGDSNVFIGYRAGYKETGSNKLYIANDSSDVNVLIYGEFDNRRVGIGTTSPTAMLDVNGSTGYNQIRMRTSYTPSGTDDTNGNVGDIAWDDNYIYLKTSAGWNRAALSTW